MSAIMSSVASPFTCKIHVKDLIRCVTTVVYGCGRPVIVADSYHMPPGTRIESPTAGLLSANPEQFDAVCDKSRSFFTLLNAPEGLRVNLHILKRCSASLRGQQGRLKHARNQADSKKRALTARILLLVCLPLFSACSGGGGSPSMPLAGQPAPGIASVPATLSTVDASASPASETMATLGTTSLTAMAPATGTTLFKDSFASNDYTQFSTAYGRWAPCAGASICSQGTNNETNAGSSSFTDYTVVANLTISKINASANVRSGADITFRVKDASHFYELEIVVERDGTHQWQIWRNNGGSWTNLARGPYAWDLYTTYDVSVTAIGSNFVAGISKDGGASFQTLGKATDGAYPMGQIGLRAWNGANAAFAQIRVTAENGATMPPATPVPTASPVPAAGPPQPPAGTPPPIGTTPAPTPTGYPGAPAAIPTMTPVPPGAPPDNALTILAPSQPLPQAAQPSLCINGTQYDYALGDDFTQETQSQFARYTTSWEINQYQYPAPQYSGKSNWVWSDALSGIGRGNNAGTDDSYYVHIDDANPSRSYPGAWVNNVQPRPGAQIIGSPPNAYMLIRGVAVPSDHVADIGGRHWLSGAIESQNFQFGYTETTAEFTKGSGWWPADWTEVTPSANGYYGNGQGYQEFDTFEQFGNSLGDVVQQTRIGPVDSEFSRTSLPDRDTTYHTYGQLWVPAMLGKPAYIVFYIDRKPTNYYFYNAGVARMNAISVLQIGAAGSFVGAPSPASIGELKLKNYFTWQMSGQSCGGAAVNNPVPLPTPSAAPLPAPPVAGNIVPKLQPFIAPATNNFKKVYLGSAPPNGALVIIQGVSNFAQCPTGFTLNGFGNAYLCTGIVGQNGVGSSTSYDIGGNGLDKSTATYVTGVTRYSVSPIQFSNGLTSAPGSFTTSATVPAANGLLLAFGFNFGDGAFTATSTNYSSDQPMNLVYQSNSDQTLNDGIAMLETSVDPFGAPGNTVIFHGNYTWNGTASNALIPQIFTVFVQ